MNKNKYTKWTKTNKQILRKHLQDNPMEPLHQMFKYKYAWRETCKYAEGVCLIPDKDLHNRNYVLLQSTVLCECSTSLLPKEKLHMPAKWLGLEHSSMPLQWCNVCKHGRVAWCTHPTHLEGGCQCWRST